jgi:hypothetical protein
VWWEPHCPRAFVEQQPLQLQLLVAAQQLEQFQLQLVQLRLEFVQLQLGRLQLQLVQLQLLQQVVPIERPRRRRSSTSGPCAGSLGSS